VINNKAKRTLFLSFIDILHVLFCGSLRVVPPNLFPVDLPPVTKLLEQLVVFSDLELDVFGEIIPFK
jgi:hypothetical protein